MEDCKVSIKMSSDTDTETEVSERGNQDENESGSDSNEGLELEDTEIWNPSGSDDINKKSEYGESSEGNIQLSFENQTNDLEVTNTKACLNPTASEIVMHDHSFMRKYKSTRFLGKVAQPGSNTKIRSQMPPPRLLSLNRSQNMAIPYSSINMENPIPNVILTTMDGKPFHLAPGSQILRFVRNSEAATEGVENVQQQMGAQLINEPSNNYVEIVNNSVVQDVDVSERTNPLPISILSNSGSTLSVSAGKDGMPIISSVMSAGAASSHLDSNGHSVAPEVHLLHSTGSQNNSKKKGTAFSQKTPINAPSDPLALHIHEVGNQGSGDPVQRFMYLAGLCRVCLVRKDHVINIFLDVNIGPNGIIENSRGPHAASRYNIISALKTLLDVDVFYGDGLPENICVECLDNLMSFSVFRKKISIGQTKLNEIITQVQGTPNITLINDMGEKDIRKTDVFRHCDSIIRANDMIKSSSFSHCATRYLPDRVLDKIFTAMAAMVGFKSGKLKELEMYAIHEPYITAWFCYTCNLTIHGSHETYAQHYVEVHEINDADDVLFPCDICGSSFSLTDCTGMSQNYAEHWLQHFFFHECNICLKKMPSIKGMWVHKRSAHSSTDKIYQCNICDKAFSKKAHLDAHKKTHLDPEDRKQHLNWCKICGKGLTSSLAAHMSSVHSEERPWKCEICNKGFKRKEILNGHRSTVHYNLKKYQCELCGVYLKSHSSKAQHLLRHKGEKTHSCAMCDKSFYSSHALRSHMIKHKESGENQCTICNKIFKRKIYLTEHMRLHTGEKPHECHICGKQIRMKSNYYKHMKIHSRRAFENKETANLEDVT